MDGEIYCFMRCGRVEVQPSIRAAIGPRQRSGNLVVAKNYPKILQVAPFLHQSSVLYQSLKEAGKPTYARIGCMLLTGNTPTGMSASVLMLSGTKEDEWSTLDECSELTYIFFTLDLFRLAKVMRFSLE